MDLDDLRRLGGAAKKSAFRLETLPQYLVPQEAERFAAWNAGVAPPRRTPESDSAMARLRGRFSVACAATGCTSWTGR